MGKGRDKRKKLKARQTLGIDIGKESKTIISLHNAKGPVWFNEIKATQGEVPKYHVVDALNGFEYSTSYVPCTGIDCLICQIEKDKENEKGRNVG